MADDLEPSVRQLVVRLREIKDRMGVSTATLAVKTAFSRSSWDRYLNGRALPPRDAVEAICKVSGADRANTLALWEVAERAHARTRHTARPGPRGRRPDAARLPEGHASPGRRAAVIAVVASVPALLGAVGWLVLRQAPGPEPSARQGQPLASVRPGGFACHYARRGGRLFAGHSASEPLVLLNAGGEPVAEVQCLLTYHGHPPGPDRRTLRRAHAVRRRRTATRGRRRGRRKSGPADLGPAAGVTGSAWRALPPTLDPQVAHLITVLRELKDRSGLSLNTLAAETAHGRSSWNRYLNGMALPPRSAVEMLGRLAGEPPERLVALWRQAEARYSGRDAGPAPAGGSVEAAPRDDASPSPAVDRSGRTGWSIAGRRFPLAVIAVIAMAAVLAAFAWAGFRLLDPRGTVSSVGLEPGPFSPVPLTVGCRSVSARDRKPRPWPVTWTRPRTPP
ncbi:helix-turn-helix domain-containing protein [Streptantibioticus cattleyicolor]